MHEINRLIYDEVRKHAKTLAEAAALLGVSHSCTRDMLSGNARVQKTTWNKIGPRLPGFKTLLHFPNKVTRGPRMAELTKEGLKEYNARQLGSGPLPLYWEDPFSVDQRGERSQRQYCERMRRLAAKRPGHRTKSPKAEAKPVGAPDKTADELIEEMVAAKSAKNVEIAAKRAARLAKVAVAQVAQMEPTVQVTPAKAAPVAAPVPATEPEAPAMSVVLRTLLKILQDPQLKHNIIVADITVRAGGSTLAATLKGV